MFERVIKMTVLAGALAFGGCSFHARSAEDYRDATQALLETRNPQIKQCYDDALKAQPDLQGTVGIMFTVENETGNIINAAVDPGSTNAPDALSQCVLTSVQGLTLSPPDKRDGLATFVYQFQVAPAG
ncbi:MAG TPA: AgmX/PglI C-terminal domain-containing protein [Polyangiaceae bacterium]|jgi:hypothetical protein